jgi:hypothetical protein
VFSVSPLYATVELLLEVEFSVWSVQRLYGKEQLQLRDSS